MDTKLWVIIYEIYVCRMLKLEIIKIKTFRGRNDKKGKHRKHLHVLQDRKPICHIESLREHDDLLLSY